MLMYTLVIWYPLSLEESQRSFALAMYRRHGNTPWVHVTEEEESNTWFLEPTC